MSRLDILAELDELIACDSDQQDYCSDTGPNDAMRRVVALQQIRSGVATHRYPHDPNSIYAMMLRLLERLA